MPKGIVDYEGLRGPASQALRDLLPSDVYPETMMEGRMVFMRCTADHHGVALVGVAEWRECFTLEDAVADAPPGQDTRLKR